MTDLFTEAPSRSAVFSACRNYRYQLWRIWDSALPYAQFIGLNPSTADETLDDPTIRRCIAFSKSWGYGALCMTNLFAYRATLPKVMKAHPHPVGEGNMAHLAHVAKGAGIIIAAWGLHGAHLNQGSKVRQLMREEGVKLHFLSRTKDGSPGHPLYLKGNSQPIPFA